MESKLKAFMEFQDDYVKYDHMEWRSYYHALSTEYFEAYDLVRCIDGLIIYGYVELEGGNDEGGCHYDYFGDFDKFQQAFV